jgi:hypothetical protein
MSERPKERAQRIPPRVKNFAPNNTGTNQKNQEGVMIYISVERIP